MPSPEITEEFTASVEFVEPQGQIAPQSEPTIHDQAYWDRDAELAAQNFEPYRGRTVQELAPEEKDRLITYMWKRMWQDHQLLKQLALEKSAEAPKPRKRTSKVPKAAMPELDTNVV